MVTCGHPSLRTCSPQVVLPTGFSPSQKQVDLGDDEDVDDDGEDDDDDDDDGDDDGVFFLPKSRWTFLHVVLRLVDEHPVLLLVILVLLLLLSLLVLVLHLLLCRVLPFLSHSALGVRDKGAGTKSHLKMFRADIVLSGNPTLCGPHTV